MCAVRACVCPCLLSINMCMGEGGEGVYARACACVFLSSYDTYVGVGAGRTRGSVFATKNYRLIARGFSYT